LTVKPIKIFLIPKCWQNLYNLSSVRVFGNEEHKIYLADCIEVLEEDIPDGSIDLIFADPPYNIGKSFNGKIERMEDKEYLEWSYKWLDLCIRKLKKNGSLYVMTSTQNMPYFDIYLRQRMTILSRIVWAYDSSGVQANKHFGSMYEPILFCVKDKDNYVFNAQNILVEAKTGSVRKLIDYRKPIPVPYNTKKVPGNVWQIPRVRYRMDEYENHPTQKPVALLERIIKASSTKGGVVLDPFSGTFTTSFVAKSLDRRTIGIEVEEEYIKIGLRRLELQKHYDGVALQREIKSYEKNLFRDNLSVAFDNQEHGI
jgi:adenine-specific DNA-methyltransferase